MPIYEIVLRIDKPYPPDESMLEEALASIGVEAFEQRVLSIEPLRDGATLTPEGSADTTP